MQKYVYLILILSNIQLFDVISSSDSRSVVEKTSPAGASKAGQQFNSTGPSDLVEGHHRNSSFGRLRKCCKPDEIFSKKKFQCLPADGFQLPTAEWRANYSKFDIVYDRKCPGELAEDISWLENADSYQIFDNGSMFERCDVQNNTYDFDNYCVDYLLEDARHMPRPVLCWKTIDYSADTASTTDPYYEDQKRKFTFNRLGMGVSILFLMVTFGLYMWTPKLRQKLHDRCFLCHVMALIMMFVSMILVQKFGIDTPGCEIRGYNTQFWALACFFWLNVMCIDIWRSVGSVQRHKQSNCQKFIIYSLYAWGCPLVITTITICLDNFLPKKNNFRTGFGEFYCWFNELKGTKTGYFWMDPKFIYFYSIISITLLINVYTFIDTASRIIISNKNWKEEREAASRRHKAEKMRFFLYFKLFLVMGVNWLSEVVSYYLQKDGGIWYCLDLMNIFQGIPIFIIFVFNERVIKELRKRFYPRKTFLKEYNKSKSCEIRVSRLKSSTMSTSENAADTDTVEFPLE